MGVSSNQPVLNTPSIVAPAGGAPAQVFSMDVVWSLDNLSDVGLVWRTGEDTNSDSEYEEEEEEEHVPEGQAQVAWFRSRKTRNEDVTCLRVLDRDLTPGDIVARAGTGLTQTGVVRRVSMLVDVMRADGTRLDDLPASRLAGFHPYGIGAYVVGGGWAGTVVGVDHAVTVEFNDGSAAELTGDVVEDQELLAAVNDTDDQFLDEERYHLYPGQKVELDPSYPMKEVPFLRGAFKGCRKGLVTALRPLAVHVEWLAALQGDGGEASPVPPAASCDPVHLHPLVDALHTDWHLGDRALLLPNPAMPPPLESAAAAACTAALDALEQANGADDPAASAAEAAACCQTPSSSNPAEHHPACEAVRSKRNRHGRSIGRRSPTAGGKTQSAVPGKAKPAKPRPPTDVVQVVLTSRRVEVQWQDGSLEQGVSAKDLIPVENVDEHDFWPDDFVQEKDAMGLDGLKEGSDDAADAPSAKRKGVVVRVNAAARVAMVRWMPAEDANRSAQESGQPQEEAVSVYALETWCQIALGDIVLALRGGASPSSTGPIPVSSAAEPSSPAHASTAANAEPSSPPAAAPDEAVAGPATPSAPHPQPVGSQPQPGSASDAGWQAMMREYPFSLFAHNSNLDTADKFLAALAGERLAADPAQPNVATPVSLDCGDLDTVTPEVHAARAAQLAAMMRTVLAAAESMRSGADGGEAWRRCQALIMPSIAPGGFSERQRREWHQHTAADGRPYFWNSRTGTSVWEKPLETYTLQERADALTNWAEARESGGRPYYVHRFTQETVWEMPLEVAASRKLLETMESGARSRAFKELVKGVQQAQLALIGEVVGFNSGAVVVAWADGTRGEVHPEQLYVITAEDEEDPLQDAFDEYAAAQQAAAVEALHHSDSDSWVTDSEEPAATNAEEAPVLAGSAASDATPMEASQAPEPSPAVQRLVPSQDRRLAVEQKLQQMIAEKEQLGATTVTLRALADAVKTERPGHHPAAAAEGEERLQDVAATFDQEALPDAMQVARPCEPSSSRPEGSTSQVAAPSSCAPEAEAAQAPDCNMAPDHEMADGPALEAGPALQRESLVGFKAFDWLEEPTGHHFLSRTEAPANMRAFQRRVRVEQESLQAGLPPSIWVRAYESRLDLLRAAMAGPAGTPYHNCLFFFDILLPSDYPATPPLVHYHSHGLRVNPNLYENGHVCLSLLNTWQGRGTECWDAQESTLLQVLVSIQGLVLVPEPYYNEAGFDRQQGSAEGARNARLYNESAFLLCCKATVHTLRRPPAGFEALIKEYFAEHGPKLLQSCVEHLGGGSPLDQLELAPAAGSSSVGRSEAMHTEAPSQGFRLILAPVVPHLKKALADIQSSS